MMAFKEQSLIPFSEPAVLSVKGGRLPQAAVIYGEFSVRQALLLSAVNSVAKKKSTARSPTLDALTFQLGKQTINN